MAGLKDQLLKSGLVNEKQLKKAIKEQGKQNRSAPRKDPLATQDGYLEAQKEKQARDRDLNRQRLQNQQLKARRAEAAQLIDAHRLTETQGDVVFNLNDAGKIKRLHISEALKTHLVKGSIGIVRLDGPYQFVPRETIARIQQRCPEAVILLNAAEPDVSSVAEEDPYAQFVIPDDLTW